MSNDETRSALETITGYLDAGLSLDAIRTAGWGAWIDYFNERGVDLEAAPTISPPQSSPDPAEPPSRELRNNREPAVQQDRPVSSGRRVSVVAVVGNILGLAIIAAGVGLAIWNAVELGDLFTGSEKFRSFAGDALFYLAIGGIVYLTAEILDRVTTGLHR